MSKENKTSDKQENGNDLLADFENYINNEWCNGIPFEGGMNAFESILNLKLISNE